MNPQDFATFVSLCKQRRGWSKSELSKRLGCGINQIGIWAENGAPRYIGLACAALEQDLEGWRAPSRIAELNPENSRAAM
jgi:hypothetical protein